MRATLIHNPDAGDGNLDREALVALAIEAGLVPRYRSSKQSDLADALREPVDVVVVAGGDGTVASVLRSLPRREVPVIVVPLGTANNIARSLGIAGEPRELLTRWRQATRRAIRLCSARGPWGSANVVEGAGFGALAEAARLADGLPHAASDRLQQSREALSAILADARPTQVEIAADGQDLPGPFLLVEVLNLACIGPGLCLAPGADPGDRELNLVGVTPDRRDAMMAWLREGATAPPPVSAIRARRVRAKWRGTAVHLDDGFPEMDTGECDLELEEEPVTVLVPRIDGSRS